MRKLILVGKARRRDGFDPLQERFVGLMPPPDGIEGIVVELIVVAVVAKSGGALGKITEIALVLLVEERVLRGEAFGERLGILGKSGQSGDDGEKQDLGNAHRITSVNQRNQRVNIMVGDSIWG